MTWCYDEKKKVNEKEQIFPTGEYFFFSYLLHIQKDLSSLKIYIGNFEFKDFSFANSDTKKIEMRENSESLY